MRKENPGIVEQYVETAVRSQRLFHRPDAVLCATHVGANEGSEATIFYDPFGNGTPAPSFANRIAVASPIPDVPPVISATLFSSRILLSRPRQPAAIHDQRRAGDK